MGSSAKQGKISLKQKETSHFGFGSTPDADPEYVHARQEYLELRCQSSDLTCRRPRFMKDLNDTDNRPSILKNIFVEAELAFMPLSLAQNIKDNAAASVSTIISNMRNSLLKIGANAVNSLNASDKNHLYDCVQKVHMTDFWRSVEKFLIVLFKWIEAELIKILKVNDTAKKCWAAQDVLDQAEDLLWGIFA